MNAYEQSVELAGALAGLTREHAELVSLCVSLARVGDRLVDSGSLPPGPTRYALERTLAELRIWAAGGATRGRQRRADEALGRYKGGFGAL
jgi:hypothetical protein